MWGERAGLRIRTAVVTGASSGIGRELARQLAVDRGARVLAVARRIPPLQDLSQAEGVQGRITTLAGDVTSSRFRAQLLATAEELFPEGIDLLVNNAGAGSYGLFAESDQSTIERLVALNLVAVLELTRLFLPGMLRRRAGQVLQITSVLGELGLPCSATYVATKHGVHGLVRSLRYELRGTGVRVWAAMPNRTVSEFHGVALGAPEQAGAVRSWYAEPTERVVRGILRGIDRKRFFLPPTWRARAILMTARWLTWPYEQFMDHWALRHFLRELDVRRRELDPPASPYDRTSPQG